MKPLHRPMFRYGGPIKEGVMSGIRENYKRAGLVGDPVYPRTNGREHHSRVSAASKLPIVGGILQKTKGWMPRAWDKIKGWTGTTAQVQPITKVTKSPVTKWSGPYKGTTPGGTGYQASGGVQKVWTPKGWVARDPTYKLGQKIYEGKGYIGKPIKGLYNLAKTPTGGIGLVYVGTQWLWPDGTPANENEINQHLNTGGGKSGGVPGGGDPGMKGDGSWFAEQENIAKQKEWNNRIKKYRDIMDIKGMNKEAAYKSLVDASKLIQESQDFKGDIKSGKLINQVIQAASKQFDKPSKTSDAINTLILQNELKKDLSAETDALDKAYKQSAILLNQKKLAGESLSETINASYQRTGQFPSGATLAGVARTKGIDAQVLPTKDIPKGTEPLDYIVSVVTESHRKGKPFPPGDYVIKDRLITIDETGKITPLI
jgi:hypothetical protein